MRLMSRTLAVAAAAGLVVVASPAFAAGPYTVAAGATTSGPVAYTATSGPINFDTSAGLALGCDSGTAAGDVATGASADGVGIASIDSSTFVNCQGPLGIPLDVTQTASWSLNATGPAGTVTDGTIDQVSASVSNPDGQCSFDVTGAVNGTFDSGDQTINVVGGDQVLNISNVVGCFGLINEGDTATFTATYAVSNAAGPITIS